MSYFGEKKPPKAIHNFNYRIFDRIFTVLGVFKAFLEVKPEIRGHICCNSGSKICRPSFAVSGARTVRFTCAEQREVKFHAWVTGTISLSHRKNLNCRRVINEALFSTV